MMPSFLKRKNKSSTGISSPLGMSPVTSASSLRSVESMGSQWSLQVKIESPPIVLYGTPVDSAGAIVSGLVFCDSSDGETTLEYLNLRIVQKVRYSKPFMVASTTVASCKSCQMRVTELSVWDIIDSPTTLVKGRHAYPFSTLLSGSLPPSARLGSASTNTYIQYDLIAEAKAADDTHISKVTIPLHVTRSITRGPDRNSLRVFPPTEVTAGAVLPNVFYPKSTFPIELRLDNVVSTNGERRWRMRKLSYKVEEHVKIRAYTCDKHLPKLESIESSERKTRLSNVQSHVVSSKGGNLHHSTIQTNMQLLANPSQYSELQQENLRQQPDGDRDEEAETEETNQVEDAHESFIEDFLNLSTEERRRQQARHQEQTQRRQTFNDDGQEHLYLEETRVVSHGEIKSGWKSDFSNRGKVELVAHIDVYDFFTGWQKPVTSKSSSEENRVDLSHQNARASSNVACDIDDPVTGIFVTHTLVVEVVVAEELVHDVNKRPPIKKTSSSTSLASGEDSTPAVGVPTGAARVLRMQFKMPLTERPGLGMSWDDEVPPMYEDVRCLSPPKYQELLSDSVVMSDSPTLGAVVSRAPTELNLNGMDSN